MPVTNENKVFLSSIVLGIKPMSNLPQNANNGNFVTVFHGDIDQNTEMLCNARDLHKFLGVQTRFNDWIKNRISEYGFVKSQDYISFTENLVKPKNGRKSIQYHITLDMAKELAMVEKNAKGREIRRYFIECEKQTLAQNYTLLDQYNKAVLEFEKLSDVASEAGRMLNLAGKRFKPEAKQKVIELSIKIQPYLPFSEFGGVR